MCNGPRKPAFSLPPASPDTIKLSSHSNSSSLLLLFAAFNDLPAIKHAVEVAREDLSVSASWYCRLHGLNKMGFADRTPLMMASLYGSTDVINYILRCAQQQEIDVNRPSESDGATALHLAAYGGSPDSLDAVKILVDAGADVDAVDHFGRRPGDMIAGRTAWARAPPPPPYPKDPTLPDIRKGVYGTDEFRMYTFKVKPCTRAYSHDWTECPFVHPGENARRRDPRKYHYSSVPCLDFRKGSCRKLDGCEYAHGVFECWLHPAQYRTRLCKDADGCKRRVCFFAHNVEELRPVNHAVASVNGPVLSARMGPTLHLPSMMGVGDFDVVDYEPLGLESSCQQKLLLDEIQSASNWGSSTPNLFGSLVIDRGSAARLPSGVSASPATMTTTAMGMPYGWGSPKVDWGVGRVDLNGNNEPAILPLKRAEAAVAAADEPDFSWVQSLVRDGSGGAEMFSPWVDQQTVA